MRFVSLETTATKAAVEATHARKAAVVATAGTETEGTLVPE